MSDKIKNAHLRARVPGVDKAQMIKDAEALNMSLSEYILSLHKAMRIPFMTRRLKALATQIKKK